MLKSHKIILGAGLALFLTGAASDQDFSGVVAARQGQFYILDYNLKVLEDMGANKMPYERETAVKRAENIYMVTRLNQDVNWLPGSDQAGVPRSRALGVRANSEQFKKGWIGLMKSAEQLKAVAADGPPMSLAAAASEMRATCNSCHVFYRPGYRD